MRLEIKGKIVVRSKYFYTLYDNPYDMEDLSVDSYKKLCKHCDEVMFNLINSTLKKKFIYLKMEEAGIKSINSNIVEEVFVVAEYEGKRIKLNSYNDFATSLSLKGL